MPKPKQNRKRVEVGSTEFRQKIAAYLNSAAFDGNDVLVSREGIPTPIVAVIRYADYQRLLDGAA